MLVQTQIQIIEFRKLVLRQRLGREQVKRPRVAISQNRIQDRQVVAQRLPRSRGRNNHHILSRTNRFRRRGLMRVKPPYALGGVSRAQFWADPVRELRPLGLARRIMPHGGQDLTRVVASGKGIEHLGNSGESRGALLRRKGRGFGSANGERVVHRGPLRLFAFCSLRLARRALSSNLDFSPGVESALLECGLSRVRPKGDLFTLLALSLEGSFEGAPSLLRQPPRQPSRRVSRMRPVEKQRNFFGLCVNQARSR